jgi:hypothetical protein
MDNKTLKELVAQVAEIKEQKPTRTASSGRLPKEWVTETDPATGEEFKVEREIPLTNDSLGWEIVKLKPQPKLCELGCGDIVCGQVVERRFAETPKPHWRTRCRNCGCYLTPDGEGFVEGGHAIQSLYHRHFTAAVKLVAKQGTPEEVEIVVYEQNQNERKVNWVVDAQGTITYQDNSASVK